MNSLKSCVIFAIALALTIPAPAQAESILGAWTIASLNNKAEGGATLVFTVNGYYYLIQNARVEEAPGGVDGFERGTYEWNAQNGELEVQTLLDTNGDLGISEPGGTSDLMMNIAGDTAVLTFIGEGDGLHLTRISSIIPIVGGWVTGNAAQADSSSVLVFLPNNVYFMARDGVAGGGGQDGMEHGIWTWSPATGAFTSSRTPSPPYADTNGQWGLSNPQGAQTVTVSANLQSLTLADNSGSQVYARIGNTPPGEFRINAGLNDAWYNPATNGQGFFITFFPEIGAVFLSWFTYDLERPPQDVTAQLGDPGHRWLTAFGTYSGNTAELDVEITKGGIFDDSPPVPTQSPDGSIQLEFSDCNSGTLTYDIPSVGRQGVVPIHRITLDNMLLCESLASELDLD